MQGCWVQKTSIPPAFPAFGAEQALPSLQVLPLAIPVDFRWIIALLLQSSEIQSMQLEAGACSF